MFHVSVASRLSVAFSPFLPLLSFAFGPITSPESNWLGTQLTDGRWLARLYQSKSFDSSAGRAGRGTEPYLRFFLVRNEEVVGSNPISGLERLPALTQRLHFPFFQIVANQSLFFRETSIAPF
jgi:hypothetical protein